MNWYKKALMAVNPNEFNDLRSEQLLNREDHVVRNSPAKPPTEDTESYQIDVNDVLNQNDPTDEHDLKFSPEESFAFFYNPQSAAGKQATNKLQYEYYPDEIVYYAMIYNNPNRYEKWRETLEVMGNDLAKYTELGWGFTMAVAKSYNIETVSTAVNITEDDRDELSGLVHYAPVGLQNMMLKLMPFLR